MPTVKVGHIRKLRDHCNEILSHFDEQDAPTEDGGAPDVPVPPEVVKSGPSAKDATSVQSITEAFGEMSGRRDPLTVADLNRLRR